MSYEEELLVVLAKLKHRIYKTCLSFAQDLRSRGIYYVDAEDFIQDFSLGVAIFIKENFSSKLTLEDCWRSGLRNVIDSWRGYLAFKRIPPEKGKFLENYIPTQWRGEDPLELYIYKEQAVCKHSWHKITKNKYECSKCGLESPFKDY